MKKENEIEMSNGALFIRIDGCGHPECEEEQETAGDEMSLLTEAGMSEWAAVMRERAAEIFNTEGNLAPVFMFVRPNARIEIVVTPDGMENEHTKDILAGAVREFAARVGAIAVLFICEAWVSMVLPDENGEPARRFRAPSEDPKREEVLMATLDTHVGSRMWTAQVNRGSDAPFAEEWEEMPGVGKGRFTDFLQKPEGVPQ